MKTSIKLISGAAILLATLSGQAIAQETIKVGMSGKYFPFTFVKQDKLQGFEVDMWNQIGERTGYKVEFVTASFSGLFGMLETGRIDTISNQITITDERKAKYHFSQPYVYDGAQIVVRKGNSTIHGIKDLEGKKVAVNLGSNFEELLRKNDPNKKIDIRTYDSAFEQDVALGRIDAFVMDRVSTAQLIKESKLPLQQAGAPFETIENALPFLKTPEKQALLKKVDEALTAMRKDGSLRQISEKWFASDITDK
ncbi:amino acid ABC transporter substrate-binding protein [Aeromonas veronii]|uniref:amino acid ABC transporter substrate-binding protein n=1 Tax=Aeromonas veronii TaxID=654 RepID=UPI0035BA13C5